MPALKYPYKLNDININRLSGSQIRVVNYILDQYRNYGLKLSKCTLSSLVSLSVRDFKRLPSDGNWQLFKYEGKLMGVVYKPLREAISIYNYYNKNRDNKKLNMKNGDLTPVDFEESNLLVEGNPGSDIQPLKVYKEGDVYVSCWKLSIWDLIKMLFTRKKRVWLGVMGKQQPPVWISIKYPFIG